MSRGTKAECGVEGVDGERLEILKQALDHLQSSLDLLDRACAPPHIGAQLDLALHQLASLLAEACQRLGPFQ